MKIIIISMWTNVMDTCEPSLKQTATNFIYSPPDDNDVLGAANW